MSTGLRDEPQSSESAMRIASLQQLGEKLQKENPVAGPEWGVANVLLQHKQELSSLGRYIRPWSELMRAVESGEEILSNLASLRKELDDTMKTITGDLNEVYFERTDKFWEGLKDTWRDIAIGVYRGDVALGGEFGKDDANIEKIERGIEDSRYKRKLSNVKLYEGMRDACTLMRRFSVALRQAVERVKPEQEKDMRALASVLQPIKQEMDAVDPNGDAREASFAFNQFYHNGNPSVSDTLRQCGLATSEGANIDGQVIVQAAGTVSERRNALISENLQQQFLAALRGESSSVATLDSVDRLPEHASEGAQAGIFTRLSAIANGIVTRCRDAVRRRS